MLQKKIALCLILFFICIKFGYAQSNFQPAVKYLQQKYPKLESNPEIGWIQTDEVSNKHNQITHLYLRQTYQDIEIFNANINITVQKGKVINQSGRVFTDISAQKNKNNVPTIQAQKAVIYAAQALNLKITEEISIEKSIAGKTNHFVLSKGGVSLEPIPVKLVYFASETGKLSLAWDLSIYETGKENWWSLRVDARSGEILDKHNWVTKCIFDFQPHSHSENCNTKSPFFVPNKTLAGEQYRVYAYPAESPNHGNRSLAINPFDITASPFGWHDTNGASGAEFTITRGNNAHAYEDRNKSNTPGFSPDGGASLNFDFPINLDGTRNDYRDASIANIFYWSNITHDIFYQYGFDEQGGNFQLNNYGKGGTGNDALRAEAQDGSGLNNANFATPPEGSAPRMQMFLWGNLKFLRINSPVGIAGSYFASTASFGPTITETGFSGDLALATDGTTNPTLGCNTLTNAAQIMGKIAVIDRGVCEFGVKVKNAQTAGAIAVIIVSDDRGLTTMGAGATDPNSITISSIMISKEDGNLIKNALASGAVNVTIREDRDIPGLRDSGFDNGIIVHEYGHGISTRLTGGPGNSGCLGNEEQMGEGWSDYFGMILTMKSGDTGPLSRGVGTYAAFQATTGTGIRPAPYSTNMSLNSFTYDNVDDSGVSVPHGVGFVWCTMLWEMTWAFIDKYGFDSDIYHGTGGNNKALQLVMDGLKLQPCSPGFVDGRDAILLADKLNNAGANQDLIWKAFAKRGLGYSAKQNSSLNRSDGVAAFDLPPTLSIEKKVDSTLVQSGNTLGYTIKVKNISEVTQNNVLITDNLATNLSYVEGSADNGGSFAAGKVSFPAVNLAKGESIRYGFKAKVNESQFTSISYFDNHDKDLINWTSASLIGSSNWSKSSESTLSPNFAWFAPNPATQSDFTLTLKSPVKIGVGTFLSFYHSFDTEDGIDGGVVEISSNGGSSWLDLGGFMIENSYNRTIDANTNSTLKGKTAFSGKSEGFIRTTADLSSFAGSDILIRFRFATNDFIARNGWYLDDVYLYSGSNVFASNKACVSATGSGEICSNEVRTLVYKFVQVTALESLKNHVAIQYFPNPSQGVLNIKIQNEAQKAVKLSILNLQGLQLIEKKNTILSDEHTETLQLDKLSKGIYFLKLELAGRNYIGKLVLN